MTQTSEIRLVFAVAGCVVGMMLSAYVAAGIDSYLEYRNSQYMQQYWAELKDLTVHNDVEVTYINPKVFDFFSLTPYFVVDVNVSKEVLNENLLRVGWSNKDDYYVKEINGIQLKLSTKELKEGIRIRLDIID